MSNLPPQSKPPNVYASPTQQGHVPVYHQAGDATGGVIPYKNPKALIAYYGGIAGLFPVLGLPFAIAAFVLGILGLLDRSKNPAIKGSVHAWIGIILGAIASLYNTGFVVAIIVGILSSM